MARINKFVIVRNNHLVDGFCLQIITSKLEEKGSKTIIPRALQNGSLFYNCLRAFDHYTKPSDSTSAASNFPPSPSALTHAMRFKGHTQMLKVCMRRSNFHQLFEKVALLFKILSQIISTGLVRLVHDNPVDPAMNIFILEYIMWKSYVPYSQKI